MPELTDLQAELLDVMKKNCSKDFFTESCDLTNEKLFKLMKVKPNHVNYISAILTDLKRKKKISAVRKQISGYGLKRIITIL